MSFHFSSAGSEAGFEGFPEKPAANVAASVEAPPVAIPPIDPQLRTRVSPHYLISETELIMLERGRGGADRTWQGLALGVCITCTAIDWTTTGLSAYHHADRLGIVYLLRLGWMAQTDR